MRIDINKQYRTKEGHDVQIFTTAAPEPYPVVGVFEETAGTWAAMQWTSEGELWRDGSGSQLDLEEVALDGELCEGWKDTNHPAFPVENTNDIPEEWRGMTMRQYYKAHAPALPDSISGRLAESLAGPQPAPLGEMRTSITLRDEWVAWYAKLHANWAAAYAAAMLEEDQEHANSQD